jgi:protein phosphatase
MGGHNAGDVASKLVATSLANYFEATEGGAEHELSDEYGELPPAARRLVAGVTKANRDVHTISTTHHQHHGMGSTCVAIHFAEGMVHIAHVGDSRCYRIREGEIEQLTRDHSLINDALDMKPDLTKEELARLPKNIITRALGMKDVVKVDVKSEPAVPGDTFLLCSDGLTGMVAVEQIVEVLQLTPDPQEACELLVAEANDHGGTDNISALLVHVSSPAEEAASDAARPELLVVEETAHDLDGADTDGSSVEIQAKSSPPPPKSATPVSRARILEIVGEDEPLAGSLEEAAITEEEALALASGAEIDLDVRATTWTSDAPVYRCPRCRHELFAGNLFCVECGARIEEAPPADGP